jgi:peptide/nickel transport system permease protein
MAGTQKTGHAASAGACADDSISPPMTAAAAESTEYSDTFGKRMLILWKRFRKNAFAVVGLVVLAAFYAMAALASLVGPYPESGEPMFDIYLIDLKPMYSSYKVIAFGDLVVVEPLRGAAFYRGADQIPKPAPAAMLAEARASGTYLSDDSGNPRRFVANIMGRDELGRDVFSRILFAGRISLTIGFVSVGIAILIGTVWGCLAGYYGGIVDNVMMRIVDAIMCIPTFLLLVTVMSVLKPNIFNVMIVLGLTGWTGIARLVRAEFLSLMRRDYVEAARGIGAKDRRIIFRHVLPNAMGPIIVAATMGVAGAILSESGLSFFGLGVQPPAASWGNMLTNAQELNTMVNAPWKALYPGAMIFVTVLCYNFLGDGLRDALDPRLKNT